ncbi:MAG: excinuclease ABC subunit UvrB [candidate division Zixibacteria bacterium]|nr:excinuclease ABC subunit UvrB [Candidatus Tariuqbacter arcticus]
MTSFKLTSDFGPRGDQQEAIDALVNGIKSGEKFQTLLGVTGSGKTFTMANVIEKMGLPTLVMSHNKTLAAQLFGEFKGFFPENAVEYFISYYDYYQPEAYLPVTDTYIEKEADINEDIDRLRLRATASLMEREDVIIVASVSCIFGLGAPKDFKDLLLFARKGEAFPRDKIIRRLVDIHYTRNDLGFPRGTFRVRGDTLEIHPAYDEIGIRIEMWGDTVERISEIDILTAEIIREKNTAAVYPAKHFVTTTPTIRKAIKAIRAELNERLAEMESEGRLVEAQRLSQRTRYDIEMMEEVGYCSGIENYSRHLAERAPGEAPSTLFDYFPEEYLLIIDESHATIPQVRGMYLGDRSRKENLVEYGFRLPSALDNRPLYFEEFESKIHRVICVSATPADYELEKSGGVFVEQIIRPTGLMDPEIDVRPSKGQIDDLLGEINIEVSNGNRILVLTLTKRMAEDLTDYLKKLDIRVRYLHSEIQSLERVEILRELRLAEFDVLVGINLLREGLDLPEVSLVAILDADKEGFLRSARSLMQTSGRAARNVQGRVIFYADNITNSMRKVIDESNRRRRLQAEYNERHGITPRSIVKTVDQVKLATTAADAKSKFAEVVQEARAYDFTTAYEAEEVVLQLEREMRAAAKRMEFERAAQLRDEIVRIKGEFNLN